MPETKGGKKITNNVDEVVDSISRVRGDFHHTREACARKGGKKRKKRKKVVDSFSCVRCHFHHTRGSPGGWGGRNKRKKKKEKRKKENSVPL